jgi:3-oxoacyl-[acyl-carrier-protein] synthase II
VKVFITGVGLISPVGVGREENWEALRNSVTRVEPIPENWLQYADYNTRLWAPLPQIDYEAHGFRKTEVLQLDPASLVALIATREALDHAGIQCELKDAKRNSFMLNGIDPQMVSVNFGASFGGGSSFIDAHAYHFVSRVKKGLEQRKDEELSAAINALACPPRFNPFSVSMILGNMVPASVAMKYSIYGKVVPTVQACSSGTTAIGQAAMSINSGEYGMAICGGVEYTKDDHGICFYGFDVARTMVNTNGVENIKSVCRPFDRDRSGLLYAEGGAASLILESEAHMVKRGGKPIAEIVGFGETFDAYSIMAPDPSGVQIERMMRMALDQAGVDPGEIDYVNAHGTGTVANDKTESEVIERVFGRKVAVNSTKSLTGHTFGASGAIEAAVCALSLRDQELHPSLNLINPIADLNFITEHKKMKLNYAFSQSFAFGGHNSGLVIRAV